MSGYRQSGRTTLMVEQAVAETKEGERSVVVVDSPRHMEYTMHLASKVEGKTTRRASYRRHSLVIEGGGVLEFTTKESWERPQTHLGRRDIDKLYVDPYVQEQVAAKLSREYVDRTERYDRTVCTGPIRRGEILPASGREAAHINKNARSEMLRCLSEAAHFNITKDDLKQCIRMCERYGRPQPNSRSMEGRT